jgi:glycosyltransferase involved in cell wall biosynthesis
VKAKVTVGICVKNGEKMLPNAIDSILNQNYPRELIQLILVDDGSTDTTPQILKKYVDQYPDQARAFKSSWQGLGSARNYIVGKADGKYLIFVDADEILTPNYIKTQIQVMEDNPKVGITAGVFKTVPNNFVLNLEVAPNIVNQKSYGKPKNFIWKTEKLIGTGGTAFRTQAIREVNGFDTSIKGAGEDLDLVIRIKKAGWLLVANDGELYELHGGLKTPQALLKKYYWYGYGCQRTYNKTGCAFSVPRMTPLAGLATGLFYSFPAYRYLRQKQMFLLPIHYGLKLTAWTCGFMKGQLQKQN